MHRCQSDHSVFSRMTERGRTLLIVYVDFITIPGDDTRCIEELKTFFQGQFHTKDLCQLLYFLGIEVVRSKEGINLSLQKYVLDIMEDRGLMGANSIETPMDPNVRLCVDQGELLSSPNSYRRLVGKLN